MSSAKGERVSAAEVEELKIRAYSAIATLKIECPSFVVDFIFEKLKQWREAADALSDRNLGAAMKELDDERAAHEQIADLLLPLVGTPDGTSVGAVKAVVAELSRLRGGWEASAHKLAASLFSAPDVKIYVHGHNKGWRSLEEVEQYFAEILGKPAPSEDAAQTQPTYRRMMYAQGIEPHEECPDCRAAGCIPVEQQPAEGSTKK